MKEVTIQQVEEIVAVLTADEKQLLKDTINEGGWGDAEATFLDENGKDETCLCTATVRTTHTAQDISRDVSFQRCSGRFTRSCALRIAIKWAGMFLIATIGGAMVLETCYSLEVDIIGHLSDGLAML